MIPYAGMSAAPALGVFLAVTAFNGALVGACAWLAGRGLLHAHWILPSFSAGLAWQWVLLRLFPRLDPAGRVRSALLFLLAFAAALGVVVYPGVLECGEGCARKAALAFLLTGFVFWGQSLAEAPPLWDRLRCRFAAAGCLLWGAYLLLYHRGLTYWMLDIVFFIVALLLWLGRSQAVLLVASLGIVSLAALRGAGGQLFVVCADLALLILLLASGGRWVEDRLALPAPPARRPGALRLALTAAVFALLAVSAARPAWLMVSPQRRQALLEERAPSFPVQDPKTLSAPAARLRGHVLALSEGIGDRSAYLPQAGEKAQAYIRKRLSEAGYEPETADYQPVRRADFLRRQPYRNVEARLRGSRDDGRGVWVVGAHYDTAPGTPGADDNASGVAVLLETARLLRESPPAREVRFAAFDAEEPPHFGTRDMGSLRYVDGLVGRGVRVRGFINLEMVGYFNPRPGSQLFPPLLQAFYPDRGDFLGLAGNLRSRGLSREFAAAWRAEAGPELLSALLPFIFSTLAVSDQLNFWYSGCPALMLTDTAFFRNPNYHQDTDTAEKLDYERMARAVQALAGTLRRIP